MDPQPRRIAADGRSTSQITVSLLASDGSPAPDGTEVRFSSTAGSVVPVARVVAGRAIAVLTSGTTPNIAQVTALAGGSSSITEVEFVSGDYQPSDVMLRAQGELGYSIDQGLLIVSEGSVEHAGLKIEADTIEFDERRGQIRAQGNATLSRESISVAADALWYSPEDTSGALLIIGRTPSIVPFRADLLSMEQPRPAQDTRQFEPFRATSGRSWITAESAVIWPRERIQFTRAQVLVDNRPVLSLPHYFFDYRATAVNPIAQQLRFTQYEGFVLDLPFFFQFREERSAAVRLRYAGRGSSYGGFTTPRKGMSLGLEQSYNAVGGGGRLFLDAFTHSERALQWTHTQTLPGARRLNASVRYQPVSDYARNALSGNANYSTSLAGLDLGLSVYGSRSQARAPQAVQGTQGTLTTRFDARARSRPIASTGLSWRTSGSLVHGPVGTRGGLETGFYQTLGFFLANRPVPLGFANLTLDGGTEKSFGARSRTSVRARGVLSRPLGPSGDISVTWDQEFAGGQALSSAYRKSLTASASAGTLEGLHGYAFYSWIPDNDARSLSATASRAFARHYRLELNYTYSSAGYEDAFGNILSSRYSYFRASLVRRLGMLDISLSFSPQGRDYGLKRGQKIWIELGGGAF